MWYSMKKLLIVANWKSNKTNAEAISWLHELRIRNHELRIGNKEIIICPSFTLLSQVKSFVEENKIDISLGAQNVSSFGDGAYTGEVNGSQVKEDCQYVLIGHSERRKYFGEDNEMLQKKVAMAKQYGLIPIYFVSDATSVVPQGVTIICYEPPASISPGSADSPENANQVATKIKETYKDSTVLYGGNVTAKNVNTFTSMNMVDGVVVGRASLDPSEFISLITNA